MTYYYNEEWHGCPSTGCLESSLEYIWEPWPQVVCTDCGLVYPKDYLQPKQVATRKRSSQSKYVRLGNFESHLSNIQGDAVIKPEVLEKLMAIKKAFRNRLVSYKDIKAYMKENGLNKYYSLIYTLIKKFYGIELVRLTTEEESYLVRSFLEFERGFESYKDKTRTNSLGYDFLIRQFLLAINHPDAENIPQLSDKKKLKECMALYKAITEFVKDN